MPGPLDGKTALVTGGTQNIGRGIALRLAADGADVVVGYHSDEDAAQATLQALREHGVEARAVRSDVATAPGVRSLFVQAEDAFGAIDVLVANAGLTPTPSPIADTPDDEIDRMLALNVRGAFYQLREGARRVAEGGRIVAVGSGVSRANPPGLGLYAATKAAVGSLVETLAKEMGERGSPSTPSCPARRRPSRRRTRPTRTRRGSRSLPVSAGRTTSPRSWRSSRATTPAG